MTQRFWIVKGNHMRRAAGTGLAGILSLGMGLASLSPVGADGLRLETKDGVRTAIVLPADRVPAPTVIVLHGAFQGAARVARISGFTEAAAARGFTAVFPEGIRRAWNDGRVNCGSSADDVGYLRRLVGELVRSGIADPDRVYLAGVSNGGMMTLRMVCESSELFAGAGTVLANMPASIGKTCSPAKPVPITMVNGSADPLVPYAGGGVGPFALGGYVWGAEPTAAHMARANGCRPLGRETGFGDPNITAIAWSGCRAGADVTLYRVNGGRHQLFGRASFLPAALSRRSPDELSAAKTIMAAFAHADAARSGAGRRMGGHWQ